MSLYRFLTEPRLQFSHFQLFLLVVVTSGVSVFGILYMDSQYDKAREATFEARLAEARAEVQHLKAPAAKRNGTAQSTPASLKVSSETEPQTPAVHAHDDSDVSISDDTVDVVHTGPLKGLPLDLAKEIHKEYTAASMARAKRYHEWDLRRRDYKEREAALFEKELAHKDAHLANSRKLGDMLLAVYARMSPEQLEEARKEELKTQPAEVVDSFFRRVAEYGTSKSPEEINQAAQDYEKTRESLATERQALVAEREQITREEEELQRTKPLPPNLGLDEFYTEWKKRNSPKSSP